jgi:spore coat polysaccharide biosynthesis protein SpsF
MNGPVSVGAVIQARMTSVRCPGKVLRRVAGRPLLGWLVDRLSLADLDGLVVATSDEAPDDEIELACQSMGVDCHRGPLVDVAQRLRDAGRARGFDAIVRVSGDSPLLLPKTVSTAVDLYRSLDVDVVTNVFPRSFPRGQSVEVVRVAALERALPRMDDPRHREHVTSWLYEHFDDVRIHNLAASHDHSSISMAVDTEADFTRISAALEVLGHPGNGLDLDDLLALLNPTSAERE